LTAEDSAIFERYPFAVRKAAHMADQRDARLMLDLGRAVDDGRGLTVRGYIVQEFSAADFEHVTLATCEHGVCLDMLADHPNACEHCYADDMERRAEYSAVSADWFAGGFCENH
jgi:hypothetical protein